MKNNRFDFNKVFCIGMNKTGTNSLHWAFLELGLKSIHYNYSMSEAKFKTLREYYESARSIQQQIRLCKKKGEKLLKYIDDYDAYSDIFPIINNFDILDKQYPNSKFIYTNRNTKDWISSRKKHVQRNIENIKKGLYSTNFSVIDEDKWIKKKENHYKRVINYFKDKPGKLLIINICEGDGYEKLCPFLGFEVINKPFPKKNSTADKESHKSKLEI